MGTTEFVDGLQDATERGEGEGVLGVREGGGEEDGVEGGGDADPAASAQWTCGGLRMS